MKKIEPYPVALSLFFIFVIFYTVCISIKIILVQFGVEGIWHMHRIWSSVLPGFSGLNTMSVLIGYLDVIIGAYSLAYITIPIYNYLVNKTSKENKDTKDTMESEQIIVSIKTIFLTLMTYFLILFSLCIIYDLFVSQEYSMFFIWQALLPGVKDLSLSGFLIGLLDIIIYSIYIAVIFSKTLNYFEKIKTENIVKNEGE